MLGDETAAKANRHRMRAGAGLKLRQQVADVRLHRLLGEEEARADLAVHEAVRDQLKNLDLARRRLLLELLERACEGDDLRVAAVRAPRGDGIEAPGMADVPAQDLLALRSVHGPTIGRPMLRL